MIEVTGRFVERKGEKKCSKMGEDKIVTGIEGIGELNGDKDKAW